VHWSVDPPEPVGYWMAQMLAAYLEKKP
jgi:hypothetical protein